MNKVEKIKDGIERLKKSLPWGSCASQISMECNCKNEAYNEVLSYIDSLEEEPVRNDLEEAAHSYVDTTIEWFDSDGNPCCYPAFIAGAQWQKKQDQSTIELAEDHAMLAGMEKMKQRLMKDAVSMDIYYETEWDDIHKFLRKNLDGEHVKLAIIKEE